MREASSCSREPSRHRVTEVSGSFAGTYRVARDDLAFRDLLFEFVSPPPTLAPSKSHVLGGPSPAPPTSSSDLMQMGFPTLVHSSYPAICGCHGKLKVSGYSCPRCKSRICDVPTECRVCGLTVVNAPQLARSYRHLFPVSASIAPRSTLPRPLADIGSLGTFQGRELREVAPVSLLNPELPRVLSTQKLPR